MDGWFDLAMPWWAFIVRGALGHLGLLIIMRLAGKHSFGEMSPFDVVVLILVGGALRPALLGDDKSVLGPFIVVTTILATDMVLARLSARFPAFNRWVEGRPVLVVRQGRVLDAALRRHAIARDALDRELRLKGIDDPAVLREARLEANGRISALREDKDA